MNYYVTDNTGASVALNDIPEVSYAAFYEDLRVKLSDARYHAAHYFALPSGDRMRFFLLLLDDAERRVLITSHATDYYDETALPSLTALHPQMHPFERDISERYGIRFDGMPWPKPLRFPAGRYDRRSSIENYPFYTMEGRSLHEVNVGPIHAGVIEPGAFRFICNGEQVLHLEIALGYQHRDVETAFETTANRLRQMCLAESVAGDSAVAHATAFARAVEKLARREVPAALECERAAALELERMAMQIADTGALCMDVGYQLGQVASEALRTMTINTTQAWCGNRFGKGLIRPLGTDHPLTAEKAAMIRANVREIARRYDQVRRDIKSSPSLLARFEQCGIVPRDENTSLAVNHVTWQMMGNGLHPVADEVLYREEYAEPVLVFVDPEEPDKEVNLVTNDGVAAIWYPQEDGYGNLFLPTDEAGAPMLYDFAIYGYTTGLDYPEGWEPSGDDWWLPPTELGLADTSWLCDSWVLELRGGDASPEYAGTADLYYAPAGYIKQDYLGVWRMEDDCLYLKLSADSGDEIDASFPILISPSGEDLYFQRSRTGAGIPFLPDGTDSIGLLLYTG